MAKFGDGGELVNCSFCGKSHKQVKKLIAGPGVYICDECTELCSGILAGEAATSSSPSPWRLRTAEWAQQDASEPLVGQDPPGQTEPGRDHRSIGEVRALLRDEFPDVTISKLRFLESRGLSVPTRTPSGYRTFSDGDIDRIRRVLRQQMQESLPPRVIKARLRQQQGPLERMVGEVWSAEVVRAGRGPRVYAEAHERLVELAAAHGAELDDGEFTVMSVTTEEGPGLRFVVRHLEHGSTLGSGDL